MMKLQRLPFDSIFDGYLVCRMHQLQFVMGGGLIIDLASFDLVFLPCSHMRRGERRAMEWKSVRVEEVLSSNRGRSVSEVASE